MQNQEILKIIENLKGRRNYEEKKLQNLVSIHFMLIFEDKILKQTNILKLKKTIRN